MFFGQQRLIGATLIAALAGLTYADEPVDFSKDVAPILQRRCVRCHSRERKKGEISLATVEDLKRNAYVVPGDPDASYLVELIVAADGERPKMPKEGEPLSEELVGLIRRWIAEGAKWPAGIVIGEKSQADASWWSLQPLAARQPPLPDGIPDDWKDSPLDRFVFAKLRARNLCNNPSAERRTLIRRATYDLTGLPPTPQEVEAFVADPDPNAYARLIDRLLASPHYGERWGRHWLDVVRFGESNGFERNFIINDLWPFRDYVIRSLNDDKPFDRFIGEHLAGDVFGKDRPDVEVGSAFLVAGPYDDVGNQDPAQAAQIRANTIDEIIRATSEAFLGLTIGCARCHDHKFDPILQRDYYSLYATFSGVRHGSRVMATAAEKAARLAKIRPLVRRRDELTKRRDSINRTVLSRGRKRLAEHARRWRRSPIERQGTEETFGPIEACFVRLVSEGQDADPANVKSFGMDEFEVWSVEPKPRNVALASSGAEASGPSRQIEDFPGAYGPQLAIDGKTGERFLATGGHLTIQLAQPTRINRVVFSSARRESAPAHRKFVFVAEYRIEISLDGQNWTEVANSRERWPVNDQHLNHRLQQLEITDNEERELVKLERQLAAVNLEIGAVPPLPTIWVGERVAADAAGPFYVFLGGSPQRKGERVVPTSLSALRGEPGGQLLSYQLPPETPEGARRLALAEWIVHPRNPLTPRVLANRLWHYHFGTGIVDTPSDFGFMGSKPTHAELLDWLAAQVHQHGWRLKPLHKLIMTSQAYRQSSDHRSEAAQVDGDARLLWRFPPRRLTGEEIRDTMLSVAGKLDARMGGPGFRLYRFMQDNVATYAPLDVHSPDTYRRAVYHQNARASVVDLMTDFDQPDCAFSTAKRAETTTPLQALTMLNHSFTLDMAGFMSARLKREAGDDPHEQVRLAYQLCYSREPTDTDRKACRELIDDHGLCAFCRVMLNSSEMIYVR